MSFFNELKRRNVFKVAAAYIIVGWLIMQVGDTLGPALLLPGWINSALAFFLILGFPLALFFAWAFEMTPEGLKKEKEVDHSESITHVTSQKLNGLIIGSLVLALGYFAFDKFVLTPDRRAAEIDAAVQTAQQAVPDAAASGHSIAVLPFVNMSEDAANEYFSDGISEEILNALAQVKDLKVAGRTSSFAFKDKDQDLRVIGETLGVQHILEGSVRKSGNQVRITAQLIQASDGFHLWSETFDRELTDIFAIQDEIARTILEQLKLKLMGGQAELQLAAKTDVQTYELYLRARQLMNKRDFESLELAKQLLGEAIAGDPSYAPAYAQLGIATILTSDRNYGVTPSQQAQDEALPLLQKSVSLDPELAEGWAGLGLYHLPLPGSHDQSMEYLQKSLALNPSLIDASNWLQNAYRTEGKIAESVRLLEQILDRDPLYRPAITNLDFAYILTNRTDQSLALIERSKRFLPNDPRMVAAEAAHYLLSQQPVQAYPLVEQLFRSMPSDPGARTVFSIALMQLGDHERLAEIGFGWPKCVGLTRLKRVEEAAMVCSDVAADDLEEGLNKLFDFLVNSGREQELIRLVQDRWGDLDAFENDVPNRDGFAHQTMGHIARAYQLLGDEGKYSDALQRFRASLDFQRANGADNFLMEWAEGYYFALAGDFDAALTHLERASTLGFKFDLETSAYWPVYKPLDGVPRFEALKADGQRRINAEREQLGLEPLSS
jgi:TolB-like protein